MKYYEFTDDYYALIKAKSEEEVIKYYKEHICDDTGKINLITEDEVWQRITSLNLKTLSRLEQCELFIETVKAKETMLILVDGALL